MKLGALIKYVICALGHPLLFLYFLFYLAEESFGNTKDSFIGQPLFFEVSTNVYRLNFLVYVPYALILYGIWLGIQFWLLHQFRRFTLEQFLAKKFTTFYLILCGMGWINIIFWIMGMEGNVFGFIFALPLLLLSLLVAFMEIKIFFARPG